MIDYGIVFAAILTVLIEYVVLRCLGERRRRVLGASVAINILTNVPLNLYLIHNPSGMPVILLLEGIVMAIEAAWYYLFVKDLRHNPQKENHSPFTKPVPEAERLSRSPWSISNN